jgi:hypothetical protein
MDDHLALETNYKRGRFCRPISPVPAKRQQAVKNVIAGFKERT